MTTSLLSVLNGPQGYTVERKLFADTVSTDERSRVLSNLSPTPDRETSRTTFEFLSVDIRRASKGKFPSETSFECRASALLAHHLPRKYEELRRHPEYTVACIPHAKITPDPKFAASSLSEGIIAVTTSRDLCIFVYPGSHGRQLLRPATAKRPQLARFDGLSSCPVMEQLTPGDVLLIHPRLVLGFPGTIRSSPMGGNTLAVFVGFHIGPENEDEDRVSPEEYPFFKHTPVTFRQEREL